MTETVREVTISQLIKQLQKVKRKHGDIPVMVDGYEGGYHSALIDQEDSDMVAEYFFKDEAWYYGPWWQASSYRDPGGLEPKVKALHIGRGQAYLTKEETNA